MHQKKNTGAAADGRNRQPLGNIGNQISRPMTRSFRAQLLANAQAAAAVENNKKMICANVNKVNGDKPKPKVAAAKVVVQKKVVVNNMPNPKPKPKPEEVTVISPDTEDNNKEEEELVKNKVAIDKKEGTSTKKVQAFSSVLTARSKAACGGVANKPKEEIVDIDAADANNDLAEVEYVEDIYNFYKEVEIYIHYPFFRFRISSNFSAHLWLINKFTFHINMQNESRPHNYMDTQPEINEKMRAILIDWLIEVHQKFDLSPETIYLTINIIDRFLSVKTVPRRELQLVGISATLMASKYEEIWPPEVNDLVCISDRAYTRQQVLVMEKSILEKLEWNLTVPTHYVFLARFVKAALSDKMMENMVYFLAELGIMHYDTIMFCPSMVAACAVYATRCTLDQTPAWTDTLKLHTGNTESQLKDCAGLFGVLALKSCTKQTSNCAQKVLKLSERSSWTTSTGQNSFAC